MTNHRQQIVRTPAKINLGLEVLGRRDDGYHEVATVLQAVDLFDDFVWTPTGQPFSYAPPSGVDPDRDLIRKVLKSWPARTGWTGELTVRKHIPLAAGLGGGSSDAALAIRITAAGNRAAELESVAASYGSDVPFFIRGGTAVATGVGSTLQPLPTPDLWFVIIVPSVHIPDKTRSIYQGLAAADFSDGRQVAALTTMLQTGIQVSRLPPNAFQRQVVELDPVASAWHALEQAGATRISVTGAGPAIYAMFSNLTCARAVFQRLRLSAGRAYIVRAIPEHSSDDGIEELRRCLIGQPSVH